MDRWPVGYLIAGGDGGVGTRIEQLRQLIVIQSIGQGPGKLQFFSLDQQFLDGPDTGLGAVFDLADGKASSQS